MEILASHESFNNKHGIQLEENFNKLPTFHWLPKVHTRPYKFRYIVNLRSCSIKELSVRMTFVLQAIKTHVNKRAQRALERSPETKDFKFPFFIALSTTSDTWQSNS